MTKLEEKSQNTNRTLLKLEEKGFYFKGNSTYWHSSPYSKYYINELKEITNYER